MRLHYYLYIVPKDKDSTDLSAFAYVDSMKDGVQNKHEALLGYVGSLYLSQNKGVLTIGCL